MKIVHVKQSLFSELTGIPTGPLIAEAIAFGPFAHVRVGPGFQKHPQDEQDAILAHEQGHIAGWHSAIRLLWAIAGLPLWAPKWVAYRCMEQELEADAYAFDRGHGLALIRALNSIRRLYPSRELDRRIARLEGKVMYE